MDEFYVEINKEDAVKMGVKYGDQVKITSRRGSIVIKARVGGRGEPQPGMAFSVWHEDAVDKLHNIVTNDAVDPTSAQPEYKLPAVKIRKV